MGKTKRLAFAHGNNYRGTHAELAGCIPDAEAVSEMLARKGYDVTTQNEANRATMLGSLETLVNSLEKGDRGIWFYSGHGTTLVDLDGDETYSEDQALVPTDFRYIRDDEVRRIIANLTPGANLTVIADCCYSGSITRFMDRSALGPDGTPFPGQRRRKFLPRSLGASREYRDWMQDQGAMMERSETRTVLPEGHVLLGACLDTEVAYETDGQGVFTKHLLEVLERSGPTLSIAGFHRRLLLAMGPDRWQTPSIDCSPSEARRVLFGSRAKLG
jgi:hypothetical protein